MIVLRGRKCARSGQYLTCVNARGSDEFKNLNQAAVKLISKVSLQLSGSLTDSSSKFAYFDSLAF